MEIGNWYIYEIKNLINGKTYIGQRKCPKNKTPETDIGYMGSGTYLGRAFIKYGRNNFKKTILIKDILFQDGIDNLERMFISIYRGLGKAEYNIDNGGRKGYGVHSEDTKRKISEAHIGKKCSFETKQKISISTTGKNNPMFGKHHLDEAKKDE
jgi:group I intron endonuclease